MRAAQDKRFILITRKTRLEELVERFNTWPQAKFYLEHNKVDIQDYLDEHDRYRLVLQQAELALRAEGRFQLLERSLLPSYQFNPADIIVVIGQDGLVANTLKYLQGQPVIAVNPDPSRWDGRLLPFKIEELKPIVQQVVGKAAKSREITFAQATTNDGQILLAVNDLFIGPKSHTSAWYTLAWNGGVENQSSSGIIVSTGFGSTGWFRSIIAGAIGVAGVDEHSLSEGFDWQERRLQFSVREPFPSQTSGTTLVFGELTPDCPLQLESQMPEHGVIFSDGIESDFIPFNSGTIVRIGIADVRGNLISP